VSSTDRRRLSFVVIRIWVHTIKNQFYSSFCLSFYSPIIYVQQSSNWPHREKREKEKYVVKESTHRHHFTITFLAYISSDTRTMQVCKKKINGYLKTCSMMEVICRQSEHDWCDIEELDTRINYPLRQTR
jgi:hypothetical protein